MTSRKTLILIGALLVGGLAAFLTLGYVRGVEKRVDEDTELVKVVVAAAPVAKGSDASTAITSKALVLADRPRRNVPSNAVRRLTDIEGQLATIDLGGGEVVTSSMFGSSSDLTGSRSAAIEEGNVAITLAVDAASVSGGLIKPGDMVNLLVRYTLTPAGGEVADPNDPNAAGTVIADSPLSTDLDNGANFNHPASYMVQGVKVFAVGTDAGTAVAEEKETTDGEQAQEAQPSAYLTVEVSPELAAMLASVRDAEMYAVLVPPDYERRPIPLVPRVPALPGELGQSPYPDESASGE